MENFAADPKTLNAAASLETLELSLGNLYVKNSTVEIADDGSASSSLPLNGSLTGVLPGPGLTNNTDSLLASSKMGSLFPYFNHTNHLNASGYHLSENLTTTLNPGSCFGWKDSLFSNVGLFNGFPKQIPLLPSHPEAIASGGNLFKNGYNMRNGSSGRFQNLRSNGIITMALTNQGSQYLQDLILLKDPTLTKLIFVGVFEYLFQLMTNQFGRYLFQKLIEAIGVDGDQMKMIIGKLTGSEIHTIFHASIDRFGRYSLKKLIKVLAKSPLIMEVVKALRNRFFDLMVDAIGQYVIMECLDNLDSQKNELLYVEAINQCLELATDERGCIALNSFIGRIKGQRRDQLLNMVRDHAVYLALHPSGNYAVQCVLELHNVAINDSICRILRGYYTRLSMQKGGSHVVEKCLCFDSSVMEVVIAELIQSSNQLLQIAKDRYGNYVIQTALKQTRERNSELYRILIEKLHPYVNSLQHGFGRNIGALMTAEFHFNRA